MSNLTLEIIKTDLKNAFEAPNLDSLSKLAAINDALKWLTLLEDKAIDEVITNYRDEQKKQEDNFIKAQTKLWENAENIYNHIMTEF